MPIVTVGVPAYNNGDTLAATIDSILLQTIKDIEIIISDDVSTDNTWCICRRYERRDKRIKAIRQKHNLYYLNFRFLLYQASAPYFAWLAGDDSWSPTYLEECVRVLDSRPDVVGCISRCKFVFEDKTTALANGTASLDFGWNKNVATYLRSPGDNTRMYSVFRIQALRTSFPDKIMHAYDWALSAATLRYGKHFEMPQVLMTRQKTPSQNYVQSVKRDHRSHFFRIFPVLRMTLYLLHKRKVPITLGVLRALLRLNILKHVEYIRIIHPMFFSRLRYLYNALDVHIIRRL